MSVSSDSNDASDIFWPGYVDAVTNLAINLLFVIAVMSIVVLGFTLQLAQMTKNKVVTETTSPQKSNGAAAEDIYLKNNEEDAKADSAKPSANVDATTSAKTALKEIQKQLSVAQQALKQVQSESTQTQIKQALSQAETDAKQLKQQLDKSEQTKKQSEKVQTETQTAQQSPLQSEKVETIKAEQQKITPAAGEKAAQSSIAGGLVVKFSPDVVELAQAEASELVNKLSSAGSLASKRWQIQVISPKGYSEAARLSYYRVNAVRNVLLQNGVPASAIDLRISESADPAADNSVVAVRQVQ
jgi:cell division protein FtsN